MNLEELVYSKLETARQKIVAKIESEGEKASGRTQNSIRVEKRGGSILLIKGEGQNAPMSTLEIGRKAGAVPKGFHEIILRWMKDKGIHAEVKPYKTNRAHKYSEQEASDRQMAGGIAHNIAEYGTERSKNPKDIYSTIVQETINDLKKEIGATIIQSIKLNK